MGSDTDRGATIRAIIGTVGLRDDFGKKILLGSRVVRLYCSPYLFPHVIQNLSASVRVLLRTRGALSRFPTVCTR